MPEERIRVFENQKGWVIGKGGITIRKIQEESGAIVSAKVEPDWIILTGDCTQIRNAKRIIESILSRKTSFKEGSLIVKVPAFAMGAVIGKRRRNLDEIEEETESQIFNDPDGKPQFYVKGNAEQQYKAKLKIKEIASNCRRLRGFGKIKKFPFIEDRHVGDDTEFSLKLTDNPHPRWCGPHFELISVNEHHLETEKESADFEELCGRIQDILQSLKKDEDGENFLLDMWCHYGRAYITSADEDEIDKPYSLQEVKEYLKQTNQSWSASFIGGVNELDVQNIEKLLSKDRTVLPYLRWDLSFLSPTCRQIRLKVYCRVVNGENGGEITCCAHSPVVVKNVLEKVSPNNGLVYYLCAPPVQHIKVYIFIPFVDLDCHFMIRTTFRNINRTPEEKAEDNILIEFLNENLKINNGKLELPTKQDQLPEGFDLAYWRQSKRRVYSYDEDFKMKISEETLENVNGLQTGNDIKTRNDIHIHCNKWDEHFSGKEWQPDRIVEGVPRFLSFVRDVQKYLSSA